MFKKLASKFRAFLADAEETISVPTAAQQNTLTRYGCPTFLVSGNGSGEVISHYVDEFHEHRIFIGLSGLIVQDDKLPLNDIVTEAYAANRASLGLDLDDDARIDVELLNKQFQLNL